jgi:transcriptional regulator with XRE-family HTH domain
MHRQELAITTHLDGNPQVDAHDDNPRVILGDLLRQARAEAKLTQENVGAATGTDHTAVSRMESGERFPTRDILTSWLTKCGVQQGTLSDAGIRGMWRVARRRSDGDEPVQVFFIGWVDAEGRAHIVRLWAPLLVPGLLQTHDYAVEVFMLSGITRERAVELADARMERQQVLGRDSPPVVVALIDQTVLTRQLGSAQVMAGQCERLLELSAHPTVHIQVVKLPTQGLDGMLALAEGPAGTVLLSGGVLEDIVTADAGQVRRAGGIFEAVRASAESALMSTTIIGEAHRRWTA